MKPKPVKLLYTAVVAAARKAYEEGRLSAQGPAPMARYRDRGRRPCAIGAALDDKTAARFDASDSYGIRSLVEARLVETDAVEGLVALQNTHDTWANTGNDLERRLLWENYFRNLIGLKPKPKLKLED